MVYIMHISFRLLNEAPHGEQLFFYSRIRSNEYSEHRLHLTEDRKYPAFALTCRSPH